MKNIIVNINDLDWKSDENGNFGYEYKRLTHFSINEKLGATIYKLMPGKKAFPYHFHYANEEAVFVLEGSGTLRLNNEMLPIAKGDYISFPVGPDYPHQILNTSEKPLVFLCYSTMHHPDVVEYPDSNKVGLTAGAAPGSDPKTIRLRTRFRKQDEVDYFYGEN